MAKTVNPKDQSGPNGPSGRSLNSLSETAYLVLASLAEGPTHGYEIIGRAKKLSASRISLAVATLYGILDRMAEHEHIEMIREEIVDGRARRTYALTDSGQSLLDAETARMAQLVAAVSKRPRPTRTRHVVVSAGV